MTPYLFEVFEKIGAEADRNKKIELLLMAAKDKATASFLQYVYDTDRYHFRLKKWPDYRNVNTNRDHYSLSYSCLRKEVRRLDIFLDQEPQRSKYSDKKLDTLAAQICEAIPSQEVELLMAMVADRRLPYRGLTDKLVREALPHLFGAP